MPTDTHHATPHHHHTFPAMADPKIKYDIEAAVSGEADAQKLAAELRNVGDVLEGDLQQSALDAAQALESLGAKQRALAEFARLKREAEDMAAALGTATRVVNDLGSELPQASANTQALANAERAMSNALADAQASLARKKEALKQLREETTGAARRTDEFKAAEAGLKAAISATTAEVKTRKTDLTSTTQGLAQATAAEAALSKEYQLAIGVAAKASAEVGNRTRALEASRAALNAAGISTTNLAQADRNLQAAVAQVREQVAELAPAYQRAAAASSASTQAQAQNQRTLRDGMADIGAQLQRIQQIATVALGGSYIGGLAKGVADTADQFKNLQARVQLVTGEGQAFQGAWEGIAQTALKTNSALEGTGTLFARLVKAAQEGGASAEMAQQRALQLVQTINQAVQLSGTSATASEAAITQLIQGLQSGVLRGDEFNSVLEQAPRLAEAMAKGLGVTTGQLRDMAAQGQLTADVVMKSLQGQSDAVAKEFAKLPPTVGRALQNLTTSWTMYVGESDKGLVSSANAAKGINLLAQNLDVLVTSLTSAGKLWAAIKIAGLAADFGRWATQTLAATTAVEANTAATAGNAAAQTANAAAQAQRTAAQSAGTAATVASTAAQKANAAAWGSIATFTGQAAAAANVATASTAAGTAATVAKTAQMGLLGRAIGGVTGLLGGPVGLIATVVLFSSEIKSGIVSVAEWAASFSDAGKRAKETEQKLKELAAAEKQAALAREQAVAANKASEQALLGLTKAGSALIVKFDELRKSGKSSADAIADIGKDFDLSKQPGIRDAGTVLNALLQQGKITAQEFEAAWARALSSEDLGKFEANAKAAFSGVAGSTERLAQVTDQVLREAVRRVGPEYEALAGVTNRASAAAINDTDALIRGLDRLRTQGVDVAAALTASLGRGIDTANTVQALDAVKAQIEAVRRVLGDKVADGLLDQATVAADRLRQKMEEAKPGIQSVQEAMRQLGITSDADLKKVAASAQSAYDALKTSGTASAREMQAAWVKTAQAAIDANNGIAPSWVKAQAAANGYKVETDGATSSLVNLRDAANRAAGGVTDLAAAQRAGIAAAQAYAQSQTEAGAAARAAKMSNDELQQSLSGDKYGNRPGGLAERNAAIGEDSKRRDADRGKTTGTFDAFSGASSVDELDRRYETALNNLNQSARDNPSAMGSGWTDWAMQNLQKQYSTARSDMSRKRNAAANAERISRREDLNPYAEKSDKQSTSTAGAAKTYNVQIGGRTVKTTSDADAQSLIAALKDARMAA